MRCRAARARFTQEMVPPRTTRFALDYSNYISRHLTVLRNAKFVDFEKAGGRKEKAVIRG